VSELVPKDHDSIRLSKNGHDVYRPAETRYTTPRLPRTWTRKSLFSQVPSSESVDLQEPGPFKINIEQAKKVVAHLQTQAVAPFSKSTTSGSSSSPSITGSLLANLLIVATVGVAVCLDLANIAAGSAAGFVVVRALLGSMLLAGAAGYVSVGLLRKLKASQYIRDDGPQSHLNKSGTPTMGGVFFIPVAALVALVATGFDPAVAAVVFVMLANGAVGFADDYLILKNKANTGISPSLKLAGQIASAVFFCAWLVMQVGWMAPQTTLLLPLGLAIPLGALFWPFAVFTITAMSNAVNLTDGLDGLAPGTVAVAAMGLAALLLYSAPALATAAAAVAGASLGFLHHNRHPSKVFMGDTGSLALGSVLAALALAAPAQSAVWALFVVSGVFFAETVSVIAQVLYFKYTKRRYGEGRRLLKMAPLHHHLELSGWKETSVVAALYAAAILFSLLAVLTTPPLVLDVVVFPVVP